MQKHNISLVILLSAFVCQLQASTVIATSLKELSERAHQVAVGRIDRITSYKDPTTGMIRSRIDMSPTRSLAGDLAPSFTLEMVGGTLDGVRQWISGFPNLQVGDHVVLFLAGDTTTPFGPTVGLWQGVFFVETDRATGAQTLANHKRQPLAEIRGENLVLGQRAATGLALQPNAPRLTLDSFLDQVRVWRPIPASPSR